MKKASFDHLSSDYEALLRDPLRDKFTGAASEFFHVRKRDLVRRYLRRSAPRSGLRYLDVGCGKGELLNLLGPDFAYAAGCDISRGMLESVDPRIETRVQDDPAKLPFEDAAFDFVTTVCVYHHVPPPERAAFTREVRRVLRPGGVFCIIEHNPYNPVTRKIVSRTPVDADAILLPPRETRDLLVASGIPVDRQEFFLYLPAPVYRFAGWIENLLAKLPLGGQYAVFGRLP